MTTGVALRNFSVVIPSWNRSELLEALLRSLSAARQSYPAECEVIVVDSSESTERENIEAACRLYGAEYVEGEQSVRKKRNRGIVLSRYDTIIFFDSDVTVCPEILSLYARAYQKYDSPALGGILGLTEFVGKDTFCWKIINYTPFIDSFSFARKFPFQSWTIGNNVSFKKSVLREVNMFEEAFPFRLGGDDLDMSYRITKRGYQIRSLPEAVAEHSKHTWNSFKAINDRAKRWGSMEYFLSLRHPEIFVHRLYKTELIFIVMLLFNGALSLAARSYLPMLVTGLWAALSFAGIFWLDARQSKRRNPIFYLFARLFSASYYFHHVKESIRHGSLSGLTKCLSFSSRQTKYMLARETARIWILFVSLLVSLLAVYVGAILWI
jgi:glycosyltransferase involved in cell wall biosynthesis